MPRALSLAGPFLVCRRLARVVLLFAAGGVDLGEQRPQRRLHPFARGRGEHERRAARRALEAGELLLARLRIERVRLRQRHDLRLLGKAVAVGFELAAHDLVGLAGVLAGALDEVQQHAAALDMAEEAVAEAVAFVRAL